MEGLLAKLKSQQMPKSFQPVNVSSAFPQSASRGEGVGWLCVSTAKVLTCFCVSARKLEARGLTARGETDARENPLCSKCSSSEPPLDAS